MQRARKRAVCALLPNSCTRLHALLETPTWQRIRAAAGQVCDTNADAFVAMGAAYANHDQLESALKYLTKALEIDPAHPNAQKYLEVRERNVPRGSRICLAAGCVPCTVYVCMWCRLPSSS
jgi:tetratricopeptide (TPR) repeat protein